MSHGYRLPLRMAVEATVIRMPAPATLIVATWNIHGGIGIDGRYSSARIVEVLNELDADIVALQEVASPEAHENFLHEIERETGYHVAAGLLRQRVGSDFGNAVLSRYAFSEISRLDLAVRDYEPRGALDVCITVSTRQVLRVIGTHLGLRPRERREQVRSDPDFAGERPVVGRNQHDAGCGADRENGHGDRNGPSVIDMHERDRE